MIQYSLARISGWLLRVAFMLMRWRVNERTKRQRKYAFSVRMNSATGLLVKYFLFCYHAVDWSLGR